MVSAPPTAEPSPGIGEIVPAPGSNSSVYLPNPGALVVAIDPGHGGCLDWGVPDPERRGADFAEKTMTLDIALLLHDRLEEQGITVILTRGDDSALAGDDYPSLDCSGPPFRDVNGDGLTGFGEGVEEGVRSRDELQARLDLVNLARADLLLSIHINSITSDGVVFEIAATETFYTDETPWGVSGAEPLAGLVQAGVVDALADVGYERQDRGILAKNLFIVAPPLFEATPDRPDLRKQPARGALMPAVLTEVGSITLPAEHELLLSDAGQALVADGLLRALAGWFEQRTAAVRFDALVAGGAAGVAPSPVAGDGPLHYASQLASTAFAGLHLRLTNTGSTSWPVGLGLWAGWEVSEEPYLRTAPAQLTQLGVEIPALAPGESVALVVTLPGHACDQRAMTWVTLVGIEGSFADSGSAPLQLACREV